jgi:hypothetical protein
VGGDSEVHALPVEEGAELVGPAVVVTDALGAEAVDGMAVVVAAAVLHGLAAAADLGFLRARAQVAIAWREALDAVARLLVAAAVVAIVVAAARDGATASIVANLVAAAVTVVAADHAGVGRLVAEVEISEHAVRVFEATHAAARVDVADGLSGGPAAAVVIGFALRTGVVSA